MFAFVLASSDPSALQAVCDEQLNVPMGQLARFRVMAPVVTLTIAHTDVLRSAEPPFSERGTFSEQEATFWIPIVDTKAPPGVQPLSFFLPYMFVDSPLALAAGREIYGFPKDPAHITMPSDPSVAGSFEVNALTVSTFGSQATVTREKLIRVDVPATTLGRLEEDAKAAFDAVRMAVRGLGDPMADLHAAMTLLPELEHHHVQAVLLKQMRDAANGRLACYQAVVQGPLQVTRFESFRLLHAHTVTLHSTASHPLTASLGLLPSQPSLISFWVRFDSRLPDGEILWQA